MIQDVTIIQQELESYKSAQYRYKDIYSCDKCDYETTQFQALAEHVRSACKIRAITTPPRFYWKDTNSPKQYHPEHWVKDIQEPDIVVASCGTRIRIGGSKRRRVASGFCKHKRCRDEFTTRGYMEVVS